MGVATYKVTNIYSLNSVVIEIQTNAQIPCILSLYDIYLFHNSLVYNFVLMLVLRTACFKTKNFTHLLIIFL